jgi:hypothetical protein
MLEQPMAIAGFLLLGGLASLAMGIDVNWDLRNYHFYNPWAWVNGRTFQDYAPAQLQSYYSPFLDLPFFALVSVGLPAAVISFLMGAPFGIGAYFFARIARIVIDDVGEKRTTLAILAAGAIGLTGAAGVSQIGSTMNEWATTSMVLAALFVLLRSQRDNERLTTRAAIGSGLLLGTAVGLKLTAGLFAVATFVSVLAWARTRRANLRQVVGFSAAGAVGFLVTYAYWAAVLWSHFRNPFFPYFNGFFKSPFWEPKGLLDQRFLPDTVLHWILLPFRLIRYNRLTTEVPMRDPRLAILCLATLAVLALTALRAWRRRQRWIEFVSLHMPASVLLLSVFVTVSYVAWLRMFSIYRYTIPIELIGSLLLLVAIRSCLAEIAFRNAAIALVCVGIVRMTEPPSWGRIRLRLNPYLDVRVAPLPEQSLVLLFGGEPLGYVVPFLGRDSRVVRPESNFTNPALTNRFQQEMREIIETHAGPIFQLRVAGVEVDSQDPALTIYRLERTESTCRPVQTNIESRQLVLCPLHRVRSF